jgi:hypothetical protein
MGFLLYHIGLKVQALWVQMFRVQGLKAHGSMFHKFGLIVRANLLGRSVHFLKNANTVSLIRNKDAVPAPCNGFAWGLRASMAKTGRHVKNSTVKFQISISKFTDVFKFGLLEFAIWCLEFYFYYRINTGALNELS